MFKFQDSTINTMVWHGELQDPELLKNLYLIQNKTQREIAKIVGCSPPAVCLALKKFGLKKKSGEIKRKLRKDSNPYLYDQDWLHEKHVAQRKTQAEIARQLGVSRGAVLKALQRFGIQTRKYHPEWRSELRKLTIEQEKYVAKAYLAGSTTQELAKQLHVGTKAIRNALIRQGVKFRHLGTKGLEIKMPEDLRELGYIAGLLDGEGYITWHVRRRHGKIEKHPHIGVANTNPEVLKYLESLGGKVSWRPKRGKFSACGSWQIDGTLNIIVFLRNTLPSLIIKKRKAEEMLAELERRVEGGFRDAKK